MWSMYRVEVAQCTGAEGVFCIVPHDQLQDGTENTEPHSTFFPFKYILFFRAFLGSKKN